MKKLLMVSVVLVSFGFGTAVATGGDGSTPIAHTMKAGLLRHPKQEWAHFKSSFANNARRGPRGRRGATGARGATGSTGSTGSTGAQGAAGSGATFQVGEATPSTLDAFTYDAIELHCPAGWQAIAPGIDTNDPQVFPATLTFDPNDRTGVIVVATNEDSAPAQWSPVVTCVQ